MKFLFLSLFVLLFTYSFAQDKYFTKTGHIYFISKTDAIDIDANNNEVGSIVNIETGEVVVIVLMKAFDFTLALAEDHFNEDYVESDIYPKAKFVGKIINISEIDFNKKDIYNVIVKGILFIHGKEQEIEKEVQIQVSEDNSFIAICDFTIFLDDYNIKIPKMVKNRVAQEIIIKSNFEFLLYGK